MLKRVFLLSFAGLWFFSSAAYARFFPKWFGRVSTGYSYWKLEDLNRRIPNRQPFFDRADSNYVFKSLPSNHISFNLGLQLDVLPKISLLGTLEYLQATRVNEAVNDTVRVHALTRPQEINLGLDAFLRLGSKEDILLGIGSGFSFARFRDDVKVYQRSPGQPDTLSRFLLEKYGSLAIYGEVRAVYLLPLSLLKGQNFFVEALGRLNPIEAFTGSRNDGGTTQQDVEAIFFPPGSSTAQPVKLDFSGFYIGFGSNFRL
ncbi:MAG TPA: hypothetical protein VI546_07430 [candidate division Zixibacteria bacterium]|nr:hypothetical protein [candidate division Zixibacteria bacterium]